MIKIGTILVMTVAILSVSSCAERGKKENKVKTDENVVNENFDWLLGNWKRNNEEKGKETFEVWKKSSNYEYSGIGFTMQNNDTLKQEKIKLIKIDKKWILEVKPQDEVESIIFNITSYNELEFVCENKELDFPKLIKYWKNGNRINALVSGDDMEILFEFERIDVTNM